MDRPRAWCFLLVLAFGWAAPASPTTPLPRQPGTDPQAIRRLLAEQVSAWNRGDLEGFMAGYWRSDSLSFYSGGDVTRGWETTLARYRKRYQEEGREMGRLAFDLHDVTIVAPGEAIVHGAWALEMKGGSPRGLFTLWLRWIPGAGWRVVHDHSSAAG